MFGTNIKLITHNTDMNVLFKNKFFKLDNGVCFITFYKSDMQVKTIIAQA